MALRSLNQFRKVRLLITGLRRRWLGVARGISIHPSSSISMSSRMLSGYRGAITVDAESLVAFKTLLFTKDMCSLQHRPIHIGKRCFIGGGSTIMPGVSVGDESIVGAGAVVFDDVPPNTIVGGNPARVIKTGITVGKFGRMKGAAENTRRMWR